MEVSAPFGALAECSKQLHSGKIILVSLGIAVSCKTTRRRNMGKRRRPECALRATCWYVLRACGASRELWQVLNRQQWGHVWVPLCLGMSCLGLEASDKSVMDAACASQGVTVT